uniref:Alkaline ceramidase n=1 Tax=Pseudonaja textilis TaxID=8673 RepID=A0A670ZKZ2_PSETE
MRHVFSYLSSEVDWCEANFERSEYIAEYYNSISNVAFFILAPMMLWLNTDYIGYRPTSRVPSDLLIPLSRPSSSAGVFSFYYHMTLSYAGQLLDELSILWTLCISYGFWFPVRYFPVGWWGLGGGSLDPKGAGWQWQREAEIWGRGRGGAEQAAGAKVLGTESAAT